MTNPSQSLADKSLTAMGGPQQGATLADLAYKNNNVSNAQFSSLVDHFILADRALGQMYQAGAARRIVIAGIQLTSTLLTPSSVSFKTMIKGSQTPAIIIGGVSGIASTITIPVIFHVDPLGSYSITATGSAAGVIQSWIELDG